MPLYDFLCSECNEEYEELAIYDETDEYPTVECPKCKSKKKKLQMSMPNLHGTQSRMDVFDNKAGRLMEKAQGERRAAESASRVGANPYNTLDHNKNEGIHHPFPLKKD